MLTPCSYIKNTPYTSTFFKVGVLLPFLGDIIQIWKRYCIITELKAVELNGKKFKDLDEETLKTNQGRQTFNTFADKVVKLCNFGQQSLNWRRLTDIALIISGIFIAAVFPVIGTVGIIIAGYGFVSLFGRKIISLTLDWSYRDQLEAKRPNNLPPGEALAYAHLF